MLTKQVRTYPRQAEAHIPLQIKLVKLNTKHYILKNIQLKNNFGKDSCISVEPAKLLCLEMNGRKSNGRPETNQFYLLYMVVANF